MRRLTLLGLVLGWCNPAWSADFAFEDARAAYVQNMQALKVIRCRIQHETFLTDDHFDVLQQRIARFEKALVSASLGPNRDLIERELDRSRRLLSSKKVYPVRREATLDIGLNSLQVAKSSSGPAPQLPIGSQTEFAENYARSTVLCWSLDQEPNTWMWQGEGGGNDGVLFATISSRRPQDLLDFPEPPVGSRGLTFFEPTRLSPFDAFFFDDSFSETRVIGREDLDGEAVVVIERSEKKLNFQAWLAINRNFFPVRLAWRSGRYVVDVESFHETPQGACYPRRWTIQRDGFDDRSAEVRNSATPLTSRYIASIENWTVDEFRSDQPEPRLFSEIGFPEGTYCFDEDRKTYFTVGKAEEVVDTVLDASRPKRPDGGQRPGGNKQNTGDEAILADETESVNWLFWINAIAIIGLLTLLAVRRMRKRTEG